MKGILVVLFMLTFLTVSIASADALKLSIPDTTGYIGKTVTIPVNIEDANDVGSIELVVIYNSTLLDVKNVEKGSLIKGLISFNATKEGIVALNLIDSNGIDGSGDIVKIDFDILATAPANTSLIIQNANAYDVNTYTKLPVETVNGILSISASTSTDSSNSSGTDSSGTDEGNGGDSGSSTSTHTPGFELPILLVALLTIILIVKRKK